MNIITVIQARRGSTRLPDKIMMPLAGKPLLIRMYERVKAAELAGTIVVATTMSEKDNLVSEICDYEGYEFYCGSELDLLDRHYKAGIEFEADAIVKIPSDCPLIDFRIIDRVIKFYLDNSGNYDYVSNLHPATYPDGNDVEVIPMKTLKRAWEEAKKDFEREHTTPFIWESPERFRIGNVEWETGKDYSMSHRFTIDYMEDYELINKIYEELYQRNPLFSMEDILKLLDEKPEIKKINGKYCGVNWYRDHFGELKTITKEQTKKI